MALELGEGASVRVAPPALPTVTVAPPGPQSVVVLPVAGVRGPKGDTGPAGDDAGAVQDLIDTSIAGHRVEATPHTAYDDMPSLTLLFENRLV